jgi:hypothetical protein
MIKFSEGQIVRPSDASTKLLNSDRPIHEYLSRWQTPILSAALPKPSAIIPLCPVGEIAFARAPAIHKSTRQIARLTKQAKNCITLLPDASAANASQPEHPLLTPCR